MGGNRTHNFSWHRQSLRYSLYIINNSLFNSVFILNVGSSNNLQSPVAFTAVLTHDVTLGPLQTLEYDKVITNIGDMGGNRTHNFSWHRQSLMTTKSPYGNC
jgi:hypothetical protein